MSALQQGPKFNLYISIARGQRHRSHAKTGVTVLTGDASFTASYAVMGGAPGNAGYRFIRPDKTVQSVDAIVLSGGSAFGLDSAAALRILRAACVICRWRSHHPNCSHCDPV